MSGFDFAFALFSLLLGLSIAEVLGGFAGLMKLHARERAGLSTGVRIGWLVPLLAVLVVLNQLSFWMIAYAVRDTLPFNYLALLGTAVVVGGYYLFSVLVFPDSLELWPDFDAWYDQHNRFILGGMLVLNIAGAVVGNIYHPKVTAAQQAAADGPIGTFAALAVFVGLALLLALIFVRGRRLNAALLAVLIAMNVAGSVVVLAAGL